ncbi:putative ABC transport system permease protein [Lachnospiraceae bacterium]|nr:putative ABC transport system permease protein [Lachnospiraceae bacterium]
MLELKGITKSYKIGETKQQVLKGIDIKFRKNEFTSILGTSGSGKTTLLNIIGGLDIYDDGELIIDGTSTKQYKDRDWDTYRNYRVGFIFQSYNLIMHQSVLQNVEMALTLSGVSKADRKDKAVEALKKVGLEDHINKKPNQLSGGQMQRVAIARALVNDPEIILADEPTGALDSNTSIQIMDLLKEIAGDKLVIMVTHNPELAKQYSSRIIELKDGIIINDSDPFTGEEETVERNTTKTSMSFMTAMSLSFNNLLTKKGRTFMTAFAGSIGIIGISLILALSNGVNNMAKSLERDSMSDYPITIEKVSYDLFGAFSTTMENDSKKQKAKEGTLISNDDIVKNTVMDLEKGLLNENNLIEFKKYIDSHDEFSKNCASINYSYAMDLQVFTKDYKKVNPSTIAEDSTIFTEINSESGKYKLLAGKLSENPNEMVLVVDSNRSVNDSVLYSLGIKDIDTLQQDLEKIKTDKSYTVDATTYSYDDLLNKEFKVILNTDYYEETEGKYVDRSEDSDYMKSKIDSGIDVKIVGIVEDETASASVVGYSHDLTMQIIEEISKTSLYQTQINNKDVNVLTGQKFDGVLDTYDNLCQSLGLYEEGNPSSISLYPKDYDSKNNIEKLINDYNEEVKKNGNEDLEIKYSDMMKTVVGGATKVIDGISYVLIGFVAISLIVSSIMIAIITYISVLERTKEIGILRAIGASKKDVRRVFIAETVIEGFISGILGVGLAALLTFPINILVKVFAKIDKIAVMPIGAALILILLSVLLNVLAGNRPSRMAAKKDPVEALRSE